MATHPPRPSNYILKIVEVLICMEINHYLKKVFHSYPNSDYGYLNFTDQSNSDLKQMPEGILSKSILSAIRLQTTHFDGVCIPPHMHS